jgi:hypothetical protein
MPYVEILEQRITQLEFENGKLIMEKAALAARIHELERALRRTPRLPWPELPNGEGTIGARTEKAILDVIAPSGLTESEVLQGREAPPGCDPKGGEGLIQAKDGYHPRAGYHPGSAADPRD